MPDFSDMPIIHKQLHRFQGDQRRTIPVATLKWADYRTFFPVICPRRP
jgi:hypothetical protein